MEIGLPLYTGIVLLLVSFVAEFFDAGLGMGYGTICTPVLLLLGYSPLQVVPSVLLAQLITNICAATFHHFLGNVNFRRKPNEQKTVPLHLKIALLLGICGVAASIPAAILAVHLPKFWLQIYIGLIILAMGLLVLFSVNRSYRFSWPKIVGLGLVAAFNKGMSAGGYGPIVAGGQVLVGIDAKHVGGITAVAEGATCLASVITYLIATSQLDWVVAPYMIVGGVLATPLSALTIRKIRSRPLKIFIGLLTIILGSFTLLKTVYHW